MSKKNNGKDFEKLTESIYQFLTEDDPSSTVQHNVSVDGSDGKRQIDILITSKIAGMEITTAIECKDYNKKIPVGVVDAFSSVMQDINANKGVIVSTKGFSSTSYSKAKRYGITLCTAHEAMTPNWLSSVDLPILIKELKPIDILIDYDFITPTKGEKIDARFINDINIVELIEKKWTENKLDIEMKKGYRNIILPELGLDQTKAVRIVNVISTKEKHIKNLRIAVKLEVNHYVTNLSKIPKAKILNNKSDEIASIFFPVKSIVNIVKETKRINFEDSNNFVGPTIEIRVIPKFKGISNIRFGFNK